MIVLVLASLACAAPPITINVGATTAPAATSASAPTDTPVAAVSATPEQATAQPTAVPPTEMPTDTPEPSPVPEGFLSGTPVDPTGLPILNYPVAGMGPLVCQGQPTGPDIDFTESLRGFHLLCLYYWPVDLGSPDFTVTLTDPNGVAYTDTFSYVQGQNGVQIVNQNGDYMGEPVSPDVVGPDYPPSIEMLLPTLGNFVTGTWTLEAHTVDNSVSVGPRQMDVQHSGTLVTVSDQEEADPFHPLGTTFHPNSLIYVTGAMYPPNASVFVAFYWKDDSLGNGTYGVGLLRPQYATRITTDANGNFEVQFGVTGNTLATRYFTVAAQNISTDTNANPFIGTFQVVNP